MSTSPTIRYNRSDRERTADTAGDVLIGTLADCIQTVADHGFDHAVWERLQVQVSFWRDRERELVADRSTRFTIRNIWSAMILEKLGIR